MARLLSQKSEIRAIKTICCKEIKEIKRLKLLGLLNSPDYFSYPPCKAAYERVMKIVQKSSEIITLEELVEDPVLEKDYRDIFANDTQTEPCMSNKEINQMVNTLEKYRKIRAVNDLVILGSTGLNADKIDIDALIEKLAIGVTKARQITSQTEEICISGEGGNSLDQVHEVLYSKAPTLLKTGYHAYDNKNGGLPVDGVVLIAATTSGGKSTMLLNLLKNLYSHNKVSVSKVSFEMSKRQEINRLLSNLSKISYTKFAQGLLTKDNKRTAEDAHLKFYKFGEKNGCRFATMCPEKGMTIDDVFITMKPYGFNVIGIDYISLLKGVSTDNMWRVMGDVCAQAKLFSRTNKCLVILLCQLDDDTDKIRYSNAMKENADVVWHWNYAKPEVRATHILDINASKVRDGELLNFPLAEVFDVMLIDNPSDYEESNPSDDDDDELINVNAGVA